MHTSKGRTASVIRESVFRVCNIGKSCSICHISHCIIMLLKYARLRAMVTFTYPIGNNRYRIPTEEL